jgi:hypothetical protein
MKKIATRYLRSNAKGTYFTSIMEYLTYNTKECIYVKLKNYSSKYMEDVDPGVAKNIPE